jgi:hypothetical protein
MYLQEQKRLYVQTIFDFFQEYTRWPSYKEVEGILDKIDRSLQIELITSELPDGYANSFALQRNIYLPAILSLEAIKECQNSEIILDDFTKSIRLFADMFYEANDDEVVITGADVHYKFQMPELVVKKVGILIGGEQWLYNSQGPIRVDTYGVTWQYTITRSIRRMFNVTSIDDYLERRDNPNGSITTLAQQLKTLLGYMYSKSGDVESGITKWTKNLTEPNKETGTKLEVALHNALARLGVPAFFGGDIERIEPTTGVKTHSGPQTPVFDLVAVDFGMPMRSPTAVLISCKSTTNQPSDIDIRLLSNESERVRKLLPGWQVFGVLVNIGEPTADDYQERNDVRIWKQSDLQAILHARDYKYIAEFLWTPPWHWKRDRESMWWGRYKAYHKDLLLIE